MEIGAMTMAALTEDQSRLLERHPLPWESDARGAIFDANGEQVSSYEGTDDTLAEVIVLAVNRLEDQ